MSDNAPEGPSIAGVLAKSVALFAAVVAGGAVRRAGATVGGYVVVAILFVVSLCFLTFAGYGALSQAMGSILASLIVGCGYLLVALVAALVLQARR